MWAIAIVVVCALCAVFGHIVHKWYQGVPHEELVTREAPPKLVPPNPSAVNQERRRPESVVAKKPNIAEDFPKCNPAATFAGANKQSFVQALDETYCTKTQATTIRQLLERLKYDFQAIVPRPYVYPARVLQNLLALDETQLSTALQHYEQMANSLGDLGTLVKLFAWGLPVHAPELLRVFGGDLPVEALLRCNVVTKCGGSGSGSPIYTSTVQFFPVQHTAIIVATDWPIEGLKKGLPDPPVDVVDLHTLFLAHNTPVAKGVRVLDIGTDAGVMGLVAATTGAKEVVALEPSPRAARFLRFSAQLNNLANVVRVVEKPSTDAKDMFEDHFFLILAHATGTQDQKDATIRTLLQTSKALLSDRGAFVLGFEGYQCDNFQNDFSTELCGDLDAGDLAGSVVCRRYDHEASRPPQEGIVYGWAGRKEPVGNKDPTKCGHFTSTTINSFDTEQGPTACGFARVGMYCPAPVPKVSLLRNLMGWH
jgi:hypothetical protein